MKQEIKAIITDIKGFITSRSFIDNDLYDYIYKNLPDYVYDNEDKIAAILDDVRNEERNPDLNFEEVIEVLLRYIDDGKKITPLRTLQDMIWEIGYKSGELIGYVYDDAFKALKRWNGQNVMTYIYSDSLSIAAQKLLFEYSKYGDLSPFISGYFDEKIINKENAEIETYEKIAAQIKTSVSEIIFLSSCEKSVNAACAAGMNIIILNRDGCMLNSLGFDIVDSLDSILKEEMAEL